MVSTFAGLTKQPMMIKIKNVITHFIATPSAPHWIIFLVTSNTNDCTLVLRDEIFSLKMQATQYNLSH